MPSSHCLLKSTVAGLLVSTVSCRYNSTSSMNCGSGVGLCGVLTLESGYGSGNYEHSEPCVHGLWPEVDAYGTSECLVPKDTTSPTVVYSCYDQPDESAADNLSFEQHEWTTHGVCSGTANAEDFFTQVCSMSIDPLAIMTTSRNAGGTLDDMADALTQAGYEIFSIDTSNSQVELSACATPNAEWILAPVSKFSSVCGGWLITDDDNSTNSTVTTCEPDAHGPACSSDAECLDYSNCVRCASSGYCTDQS